MTERKKSRRGKGKIFYEAQPLVQIKSSNFSNLKKSVILEVANFAETIIFWTAVVLNSILFARMILTFLGVAGDNLLTFTIYALSYPLIAIFPFTVGRIDQIPTAITGFESDTFIIFFIYLGIAFMLVHLIHMFQRSDFLK